MTLYMNLIHVELKCLKTFTHKTHHVGELALNSILIIIIQSWPLFGSRTRFWNITCLNLRNLKLVFIFFCQNRWRFFILSFFFFLFYKPVPSLPIWFIHFHPHKQLSCEGKIVLERFPMMGFFFT